jgi:hypothetical protein
MGLFWVGGQSKRAGAGAGARDVSIAIARHFEQEWHPLSYWPWLQFAMVYMGCAIFLFLTCEWDEET